jgi:hypothetical protein
MDKAVQLIVGGVKYSTTVPILERRLPTSTYEKSTDAEEDRTVAVVDNRDAFRLSRNPAGVFDAVFAEEKLLDSPLCAAKINAVEREKKPMRKG